MSEKQGIGFLKSAQDVARRSAPALAGASVVVCYGLLARSREINEHWLIASILFALGAAGLLSWWYFALQKDGDRSTLLRNLFHLCLILSATITAWMALRAIHAHFMIVSVLALAILGNLISTYQRLVSPDWKEPGSDEILYSNVQIYLSAAIAAAFAFVAVLLFTSGLIEGDLFPTFQSPGNIIESSITFGAVYEILDGPLNNEFAKLLVWSFIAGYVEHFVPSLLGRLSNPPQVSNPTN